MRVNNIPNTDVAPASSIQLENASGKKFNIWVNDLDNVNVTPIA